MTSFTKADEVTFELPCALTWGVMKDKYTGYSIPIVVDKETVIKVNELAAKNNAKRPLYGISDTLYLRSNNLSPKQKEELLDKGRSHVLINFTLEGVKTSKDINYLSFRITRPRRTEYDDGTFPED